MVRRILVGHEHIFQSLRVVAVLPFAKSREHASIDIDVVKVLDVFAAGVEAGQEFVQHLLVLAFENAELNCAGLGVIALLVERLLAGEDLIAFVKRGVELLKNLVALGEEDGVTVLVCRDCFFVPISALTEITGEVVTAPAEVAQGHRKVWLEFNGLLPAGHCLCRLLLIPKVAEVVPCHDCVRIVLYCLFKRLHGFETEREYIVHIPCLGCGEPFCGRILVAVSVREPAQPVFHCRIRFYTLRIFKNGLSV